MPRRPASADLVGPSPRPVVYLILGALLLSGVVSFLRPMDVERAPLEREPPARKRLLVRIEPPGIAGAYVALVREDGVQRLVSPGEVFEVEAAGELHWTAAAPGYRSRSGVEVLPYGPDPEPIRILEVSLEPARAEGSPRRR